MKIVVIKEINYFLKYNSLKNKYNVLEEQIKEGVFEKMVSNADIELDNKRLRRENKNLREKIKHLKEIIKEGK